MYIVRPEARLAGEGSVDGLYGNCLLSRLY